MKMKQFQNVVQYSKANENSKRMIEIAEDYAKTKCNEMFGTTYATIKQNKEGNELDIYEKAKQLNEVFCSELESRSKYSVEDFNGSVQDYAQFPAVAQMSAQIQKILVDSMTPILVNATGLAMIADIHYGGYGDAFEYELKDDMPYKVSKMGRREKHTKTQTKKKVNKTITTDLYGLTTITTLPEILLGDSMIAEDAFLMALSINKKIYTLALKKFIAVANAVTGADSVVTNWNEKGFLTVLRNNSAKNGSPLVIVGDAVALKSVVPQVTGLQVLMQDEFNTTLGYMSTFNTYKVLGFDVVADDDETNGVLGLPTDKVYGIPMNGSKLIQVAIGATLANTDEAYDNNNLAIMSTLAKEIGVDIATNKKICRCDL